MMIGFQLAAKAHEAASMIVADRLERVQSLRRRGAGT
jgi:hypothetical protein